MMFANYTTEAAPRPRSTSLTGSIAVHLAILLTIYAIRPVKAPAPRASVTQLMYVPTPKPAPKPVVKMPVPPIITAPRRLAVLPVLEAPKPQLTLNLPAPPELAPVRPDPLPEVKPVEIAAAAPVRVIQPAGFAAVPTAAMPAAPKLPVATGAFEAAQSGAARPGPANAVVSAGFGDAGTAPAAPRQRAAVVGSFGAAVAADPASQPAAPRAASAEPLEILDKPRPAYTEPARKARVEGDVLLEVLFAKSGTLRVLRVVRGLGYGLEQNATDAAAKIRFRPAKEDGRAVDTVAMVRISFQMAY